MLATIGIQPSEVSRIFNLSGGIVPQEESVVNTNTQNSSQETNKNDTENPDIRFSLSKSRRRNT